MDFVHDLGNDHHIEIWFISVKLQIIDLLYFGFTIDS